jgi:hypothetical protein
MNDVTLKELKIVVLKRHPLPLSGSNICRVIGPCGSLLRFHTSLDCHWRPCFGIRSFPLPLVVHACHPSRHVCGNLASN